MITPEQIVKALAGFSKYKNPANDAEETLNRLIAEARITKKQGLLTGAVYLGKLSVEELTTIKAALDAALEWSMDYFMFAPGAGKNYNDGDKKLDKKRAKVARKLLDNLEGRR